MALRQRRWRTRWRPRTRREKRSRIWRLTLLVKTLIETSEIDHGTLVRPLRDQIVLVARAGAKADAPTFDFDDLPLAGDHMAGRRRPQGRETAMGSNRSFSRPTPKLPNSTPSPP